ncbi:hypothetical protein B296_00004240 [Ensete ventricosum]|uniref:Uncharacterized protein n=1 Tax=Ensete ventricosum TaxID=4639 RepID=A0A427B501_ENSVE|nr:hypothetical protein B296_00004240 [Ensete ventricosum]
MRGAPRLQSKVGVCQCFDCDFDAGLPNLVGLFLQDKTSRVVGYRGGPSDDQVRVDRKGEVWQRESECTLRETLGDILYLYVVDRSSLGFIIPLVLMRPDGDYTMFDAVRPQDHLPVCDTSLVCVRGREGEGEDPSGVGFVRWRDLYALEVISPRLARVTSSRARSSVVSSSRVREPLDECRDCKPGGEAKSTLVDSRD